MWSPWVSVSLTTILFPWSCRNCFPLPRGLEKSWSPSAGLTSALLRPNAWAGEENKREQLQRCSPAAALEWDNPGWSSEQKKTLEEGGGGSKSSSHSRKLALHDLASPFHSRLENRAGPIWATWREALAGIIQKTQEQSWIPDQESMTHHSKLVQ